MGHTAEVVTTLKGTTFRVAESSPDMYASIDLVANRLVSSFDVSFSYFATVWGINKLTSLRNQFRV